MDIYNETTETSHLRYGKVLVGLSPVPLTMAANNVVINRVKASKGVLIRNLSEHYVFVGDESVSIETGFRLDKNNAIVIPAADPEFLYLVAADIDCECRWILI